MIVCPCCCTKIEDTILTSELHKLRDGEVVLFKRPESSRWQARLNWDFCRMKSTKSPPATP